MKLKMVIVDLELPAYVKPLKKWGVRLGVLGLVALGGGIAYAALPVTYTDGQTLTAADLTNNFNFIQGEIAALQAGPIVTMDSATGAASVPTALATPAFVVVPYAVAVGAKPLTVHVTSSASLGSIAGASATFGICSAVGAAAPQMVQPLQVGFSAGSQPTTSLSAVFSLSTAGTVQLGLCARSATGTFDFVDQGVTTIIVSG